MISCPVCLSAPCQSDSYRSASCDCGSLTVYAGLDPRWSFLPGPFRGLVRHGIRGLAFQNSVLEYLIPDSTIDRGFKVEVVPEPDREAAIIMAIEASFALKVLES